MAKQIRRSEIAEKDLYKEVRDSAKKTITQVNSLNKTLKKTAEVINSELQQPLDKTLQGLSKLDTQVTKMNQTMDQSIKLDKSKAEALKAEREAEAQLLRIEQERQKAQQQKMNTDKKVRVENERLAKQEQKRLKGLKDQGNAYKQLVIKTRDQKNESKKLGAELLKLESSGKRNTKEYRKLSTAFQKVTRSAQKGDKALKKLDGQVGDNFRNVGNYAKGLGKLRSGFASLGLAMGGAMIIRDVLGVIKDFDQAQANLASVLGVSRDQMSALTEQSKELGATTRFTAAEVSELQLEFAKLGFTQSEIEGMTQATLNLAAATGAELGETATIVGATMRGFGLDVSETQRVTDVMSKSFSTSSLDMSKFSTAMASVAPVAKLSGKNIEETTALIGTLTDRGIDASTAGTGLRNMFLKANKAGLTFDEALHQINTSTDKTGEAMALFGTRGATLGVVLAENTEDTLKLKEGLDDAKGATEEMAEMQLKTLGGALDLLKSAWQGFILSMNDAGGVGEKLRKGLKFLADNLVTIFKTLTVVATAFLAYKSAMILGSIAMKAYRTVTIAFTIVQALLTGNFKKATAAMRLFNIAVAMNPIGLLVGALAAATTALILFTDWSSDAEKAQKRMNEQIAKGKEETQELTTAINEEIKAKQKLINLDLTAGKITFKEAEAMNLELLEKELFKVDTKIGDAYNLIDDLNETAVHVAKLNKGEKETAKTRKRDRLANERMQDRIGIQRGIIEGLEEESTLLYDQIKLKKAEREGARKRDLEAKAAAEEAEKNNEVKRVYNTLIRRSIDLQKEENDLLKNRNKLEENFAKLTNQVAIKDIDKEIKIEKKQQAENISLGIDFDESNLKDLISKREDLVVQGIERTNEYIKGVESTKLDERFKKERDKIKSQAKKLLSQAKIGSKDKAKIEANLKTELDIIDEAEIIAKKSLNETFVFMDKEKNIKIVEAKKDTNLKLAEVDNNRKATIEGIYNKERKDFKLNLLKTKKTNEEISELMLQYDIDQLEKKIEEYKKAGLKIVDLEIQLEELKRQETLKFDDLLLSDKKALVDAELAIVQGLTNAYNELADKRIAKIQEEIDMSQKRYDTYVELAKNGNITAKESMAVEAKLIAEQNRLKEKEEKRKQRVQLASSVLQTYLTNSSDPNIKNPLSKTITDTILLTEFIKSLPAFADGTEDTGINGRGIDGKGGFQAILHPNERVLTKDQNKLIGKMTNEDLSKLANDYQNGLVTNMGGEGAIQINKSWETNLLVKKLDSLENTIKNKPETNIELEEIIGGAMSITRQTKEGNTKIYNRYRVK